MLLNVEMPWQMSQYVLDPDGPCAIRPSSAMAKQVLQSASQRDRASVQVCITGGLVHALVACTKLYM